MRIKYLLTIVLFFAAFICTQGALAQSPSADQIRQIKISQLSDDQIIMLWQRLTATGLSEKEIYSEAIKRGMPAGEVQALKDRVQLLGLNDKKSATGNTNAGGNGRTRIDYSRRQTDTVITPNNNRRYSQQNNRMQPNSRNGVQQDATNYNGRNNVNGLNNTNGRSNTNGQLPNDRNAYNGQTTNNGRTANNGRNNTTQTGNQQLQNQRKTNANDRLTDDLDADEDYLQTPEDIDDVLRKFKLLPKKLEVYGLSIFNQNELTFEPNFSAATPKNYVIGPGDELIVLLNGLNEVDVTTTVTPEGNVQIPHAKSTHVSGFTIEQATKMIKANLGKIYPAINTGQTQLMVNLGNTRRIKVTVIGEANTPGTFTLSSLASPFNVLYYSGGPNENGSLRNIQLIRNNKLYKTLDFYEFLQKGISENIRLEDQDVLNIPVYNKRIGIRGEVKRPALYELKDNETLEDLIKYAGGFTPVAYQGNARIDQVVELQHQVKDVQASVFANYVPKNGDMVDISEVTNRYTNRITLEGSVYQPGTYELTAGLLLSELLKKAQGLKPEAYMERGIINRTMPNLERTAISFIPAEVITGKNDVPLMREDSVMIFNRDAFITDQKISVNGYVRKPADFVYRKGLKLADAIAMAGGFDPEGAAHHVEVSRIIKNRSDVVASQLVTTIVVDMSDSTKTHQEVELQPMDIINVPRLVNYRPLGNIVIAGEVVFPGEFALEKRDETAADLLKRAGGVTPFGSLANVQVYREGVRVNVDLTNKNPAMVKKMILLPQDSIYVPLEISYVEVAGAVNNPQFINYKKRSFKYYIDAAAGITEDARLKGAYISYPNGLNKPVRQFLFFRSYPTVLPGSRIVVPEKNPDRKSGLSVAEIGALATVLTAVVSLVAILNR